MRPKGPRTWSRFPLAPPLTTPLESKKGKFFWGNRKNLTEERVVRKISSLNDHAPTSRHLIVVVQSPIRFQVLSQNGETTCWTSGHTQSSAKKLSFCLPGKILFTSTKQCFHFFAIQNFCYTSNFFTATWGTLPRYIVIFINAGLVTKARWWISDKHRR